MNVLKKKKSLNSIQPVEQQYSSRELATKAEQKRIIWTNIESKCNQQDKPGQ